MAKRGARAGACLGVDIGSAAIKVVEVAGRNGTLSVRAAAAAPTPPGAVQEGRIADPPAVGRALRNALVRAGIRARAAAASVSGQVAFVREIRLPAGLPPGELRQAARFEVERYLPYPIAEVTYDTFVLGETRDGGQAQVEVLVVAARTEVLERHVEALRAAGLEPIVLDAEPFALTWAMARPENVEPGGSGAIHLHIGAEHSGIVVVEGTTPRVIRTVAVGGNTVTRALAEDLRVDVDEAEARKVALSGGGQDALRIDQVLAGTLGALTTEVRRSLDYYGGRFRGAVPDRVVLTGGGALLPGLPQLLAGELGVGVEMGDPFHDLTLGAGPASDLSGPAGWASLAVAAGLARRGADEP